MSRKYLILFWCALCGNIAYLKAIESHEFEALLEPKLQKEYRILSVFGEKELELKIQAILNNKVLIYDKWYRLGDKIGAYHIANITPTAIILIDKKSNQKTLRIKHNAQADSKPQAQEKPDFSTPPSQNPQENLQARTPNQQTHADLASIAQSTNAK